MLMMHMKCKIGMAMEKLRQKTERILNDQSGVGTVEVVLLILVAVGLVLIFKDKITALVTSIFSKITSQANKV